MCRPGYQQLPRVVPQMDRARADVEESRSPLRDEPKERGKVQFLSDLHGHRTDSLELCAPLGEQVLRSLPFFLHCDGRGHDLEEPYVLGRQHGVLLVHDAERTDRLPAQTDGLAGIGPQSIAQHVWVCLGVWRVVEVPDHAHVRAPLPDDVIADMPIGPVDRAVVRRDVPPSQRSQDTTLKAVVEGARRPQLLPTEGHEAIHVPVGIGAEPQETVVQFRQTLLRAFPRGDVLGDPDEPQDRSPFVSNS